MSKRKWEVHPPGLWIRPSIQIGNDWIHLNKIEDANLIAAAPELLELVKLANNSLHGTHTYAWQQKAKAVIAKALGESNVPSCVQGRAQAG